MSWNRRLAGPRVVAAHMCRAWRQGARAGEHRPSGAAGARNGDSEVDKMTWAAVRATEMGELERARREGCRGLKARRDHVRDRWNAGELSLLPLLWAPHAKDLDRTAAKDLPLPS